MLHDSVINHNTVVTLIVVLVSLHIACWSSVYYYAFKYRLIEYPYLFLSTAFGLDPSRAIAAFLLPIISVLSGLLLYLRSMLIKPRIKTVFQRRLWMAFNICIVATCVGLIGAGAVSIYTNIYIHLAFAFALFISGILIMLISTIMDYSLRLPTNTWVRLTRNILTAIAVCSGVVLGVCFVPYPALGSYMEMLVVACMTAYFCTFAYKLERVDSPVLSDWTHMQQVADSHVTTSSRRRAV